MTAAYHCDECRAKLDEDASAYCLTCNDRMLARHEGCRKDRSVLEARLEAVRDALVLTPRKATLRARMAAARAPEPRATVQSVLEQHGVKLTVQPQPEVKDGHTEIAPMAAVEVHHGLDTHMEGRFKPTGVAAVEVPESQQDAWLKHHHSDEAAAAFVREREHCYRVTHDEFGGFPPSSEDRIRDFVLLERAAAAAEFKARVLAEIDVQRAGVETAMVRLIVKRIEALK